MTEHLRPLSRAYLAIVCNLYEAGGSGDVDQHGRLTVGPTQHPLPGVSWLFLVSRGLVAGENDTIILTDLGRAEVVAYLASRARETV